MLRNILSVNPNVGIFPETFFIPVLYEKYQLNNFSFDDFYEVLDNIYAYQGYKWVEVILKEAGRKYDKNFYKDLKVFTERNGRERNIKGYTESLHDFLYGQNKIMGDKTPHYGVHAPVLKRIWPRAKFIHVVRDGVNTACSMKKNIGFSRNIKGRVSPKDTGKKKYKGENLSLPEGEVTIERALKYWEDIVLKTERELQKINPQDVLTVKYENLLLHPREEIRAIADFLGFSLTEKWIKKAALLPRPFPEKRQLKRIRGSEYKRYFLLAEKGMRLFGYPYRVPEKRKLVEKLKEIYRGRYFYLGKISPRYLIKKIIKRWFK